MRMFLQKRKERKTKKAKALFKNNPKRRKRMIKVFIRASQAHSLTSRLLMHL